LKSSGEEAQEKSFGKTELIWVGEEGGRDRATEGKTGFFSRAQEKGFFVGPQGTKKTHRFQNFNSFCGRGFGAPKWCFSIL